MYYINIRICMLFYASAFICFLSGPSQHHNYLRIIEFISYSYSIIIVFISREKIFKIVSCCIKYIIYPYSGADIGPTLFICLQSSAIICYFVVSTHNGAHFCF